MMVITHTFNRLYLQKYSEISLKVSPNSGHAHSVKIQNLIFQNKYTEAMLEIKKTLDNKDIFYRRRSRSIIIDMAIFLLLKTNTVDKAKDFLFNYLPNIKDLIDAPAPKYYRDVGRNISAFAAILRITGESENVNKLQTRMNFISEDRLKKDQIALSSFDYFQLSTVRSGRDSTDKTIQYFLLQIF